MEFMLLLLLLVFVLFLIFAMSLTIWVLWQARVEIVNYWINRCNEEKKRW
jgi:hypothetical protein